MPMSIWVPLVLLVMPMSIDGGSLMAVLFIVIAMAMASFVVIFVTRPIETAPDRLPDQTRQ
jgi:peptidoglycan/LPS O-acetylase OafA/YrhL